MEMLKWTTTSLKIKPDPLPCSEIIKCLPDHAMDQID